ncbi:unnamed protein product [Blepharisma stoltei]|uniref:IMS import disulfide relay-system CHCH-CHCH-like Cx9C domain-containing protein n=1 Tax=Blepharisma stoltei TaxID=1481888 RepID=A0AAU9K730_9CILI|nr:unnamed protein product [Blepharisma stoltei]
MCDKIQEGNEKYNDSRAIVEKSGCAGPHDTLELCLNKHKDWRKCQVEVVELAKCMRVTGIAQQESRR